MARRLLQIHAAFVYLLLYVPILVVVVLAFNGGRRVLLWEGFSTRWFGAALHDEDIRAALENSLLIATANAIVACVLGTLLALGLSRMRARVRTPIDTLAYMTLVTPEVVFGIAALIFFVQMDEWAANAWGRGLAGLFGDLKSVREGEATLLDRTMILYGSNLGDANAHSTTNMPTLFAGGGFRHGQHLAFDTKQNYPLPNLFVSMLQRMGIEEEKFASGNGTMRGLEMV